MSTTSPNMLTPPVPIPSISTLIDNEAPIHRVEKLDSKGRLNTNMLAPDFDVIQAAHTLQTKHKQLNHQYLSC